MPTTVHEHPEEWLAAALADDLSPEERRALDAHLDGCERCRALQAEFAALDETLRRELPAAVSPRVGFEARLVAGFRRRVGRGAHREKLRALAGWLLRQRGVQFAGAAAALVALVSLGQMLTGEGLLAGSDRLASGEIMKKPAPTRGEGVSRLLTDQLEPASRQPGQEFAFAAATPTSPLKTDFTSGPFPSSAARGDINVGRDVTAGFGEIQVPVDGLDTRRRDFSGTLAENTEVNAGQTRVSGGKDAFDSKVGPPLTLLNGRRLEVAPAQVTADARLLTGEVGVVSDQVNPAPHSTDGLAPSSSAPPAEAPTATPATPDVRKLVRNARAELEVAAFDAAVDAIGAAAGRDGGFLDTRNSARGGNGKVSGTLVVKVLPENLDRFLAGLRSLGDLKGQTVKTEDVTKDYYDTDARLRNARRMEDRLLKMLDEVKGKMYEVLQVEKELARVRADIETMQGQLKLYDAQVRYATVTLSVYEKDLGQPAAFLRRETATLSLLAADVEKTAAEARRIADAARAQTARSEVTRDPAGHSRATLRLLLAPESAEGVIAQVKALGRVENYRLQDERIAQNGAAENTSAQDPARVERAPTVLELTVSHDEQVGRQVSFTVVAADAGAAFEKARAAAAAAGGEVVSSNVSQGAAGHVTATLGVRVPAAGESALVAAWRALGRAGEAETRRVGSDPVAEGGPTLVTLTITDAEPTVQQTTVRVQVDDAERRAAEIKRAATVGHATVEASDFSSGSGGGQQAGLRFRLAMKDYPAFVGQVRALGAVKDFTVQRRDRPERGSGEADDADAPATVAVTLYREGRIVGESAGWTATWRQTFGQGAGALAWSLRMIGVAVAFLAPWAVLLAVAVVGARWWGRRRATKRPPADG